MFVNKKLMALIAASIFFLINLSLLSDYGLDWDSIHHFTRGQALLHYFLTSQKDYQQLNNHPPVRRSEYQADTMNGQYWFEVKYTGHPPLSNILGAFFNYILYQRLGIFPDIESYHLFIVLVSSLLVGLVFLFTAELYGSFAGIVSVLALVLYPLFLAESHFNIKDPVEAAFYGLAIYAFFKGTRSSWSWIITSAFFCGLAFGTKWNIVFIPFILFPWLLIRKKQDFLKDKKILVSLLVYPLIVFSIFYFTWPVLWVEPVKRVINVFNWYKIKGGSGGQYQPETFFIRGFNSYPFLTVLFTTPLVTLFLAGIGIIVSLLRFRKEENAPSLLILLWFFIPILRVSLPGTSIYGGLRQIMEYMPAMAILAGLGARSIVQLFNCSIVQLINNETMKQWSHRAIKLLLILSFLPITLKMIQIHPNQNVYFNPLIGGLKGAQERDYPGWGVTMGNVYRQGIEWLNENAEKNAKLAFLVSTRVVMVEDWLREDIYYANANWSRKERKGEYLMEAIYDDWIRVYYYAGEFGEKFLKPVYEIKVDDVPILKIWKNDPEHTYPRFLTEKQMEPEKISWFKEENVTLITLPKLVELMEIRIDYTPDGDCFPFEEANIYLSQGGKKWQLAGEPIDKTMIKEDRLSYPLAAKKARYIQLVSDPEDYCLFDIKKIEVYHIEP